LASSAPSSFEARFRPDSGQIQARFRLVSGLAQKLLDATDKEFDAHTQGSLVKVEAGVVVGVGEALAEVGGAEEEVAAGDLLEEEGHVFTAHGLAVGDDTGWGLDHLGGDRSHQFGHLGVIDRGGVELPVVEVEAGSMGLADARDDLADAIAKVALVLGIEIADRALEGGAIGNDISGLACMERTDRDDSGLQGVEVAGDDGLEGRDDLGRDDNGVHRLLGDGSVATFALDGEVKEFDRSHERARANTDRTEGELIPEMETDDGINIWVLEGSGFDHRFSSTRSFLSGLEDEFDGAREVGGFGEVAGEVLGRAEGDRRMSIMATGMHLARDLGAIGDSIGLLDRQSIHIGSNRESAARLQTRDSRDNTRVGDASLMGDAPFGKLLANKSSRQMFIKGQFRLLVESSAPLHQIRLEILNSGADSRAVRDEGRKGHSGEKG
jgi:hypothetical protein